MSDSRWHDLGAVAELQDRPLRQIRIGRTVIALSYANGSFGAVSGVCNHVGGPLGDGRLDGDYVVCPWHAWKFHRASGEGEPGFEEDRVPRHDLEVRDGRLWIDLEPSSKRHKTPHAPHPLARPVERAAGPQRVLGISTTVMDDANPRFSTSEALLEVALAHAAASGAETRLLRLRALAFRHCEGYYSKSARACTWPCSITQADPADQMEQVYEGLVHWADVVLVATPIRWGAPSALYYQMAERMNCIQNQITTHDRVLIRDKVATFIITSGQDNVQAVAGQMLCFFAELGFVFPPFPFVAHSRGWSAEDMERNVEVVAASEELRAGARALVDRSLLFSGRLLEKAVCGARVERGGRKGHHLQPEPTG
jgi:nitrite reductase/ring-hydroxylating ferredoxin subunit/multimeric flavodoxin WrbA